MYNPPSSLAYPSNISPPPPLFLSQSTSETSIAEMHTDQRGLPLFTPSGSQSSFVPPGFWKKLFKGWRVIIFRSWLNLLLFLIPVAYALSVTMEESHSLVFGFCLLALVPLVQLHELSTAELVCRIGGSNTGLINASLSNIVELVVAIIALRKCELRVLQSTLVGSMLSKLLLVLGMCFFAGGLRFTEQGFDPTANQIHSSLLSISVGAVLLPAAYHFALGDDDPMPDSQKQNILRMSHGVSLVLMSLYTAYLLFQLWSHSHLYRDTHKKSIKLTTKVPSPASFFRKPRQKTESSPSLSACASKDNLPLECLNSYNNLPYHGTPYATQSEVTLTNTQPLDTQQGCSVRLVGAGVPMSRGPTTDSRSFSGSTYHESPEMDQDSFKEVDLKGDEDMNGARPVSPVSTTASGQREPQLSIFMTLLLLSIVTVCVAFTADWLVEAMNGISTTISKEWVALILLPAVSSLAECATAINVSYRDQLNLSISVAVGSTIQTALFVIPFMVTVAWIAGKPLALLFDPFESLVLYISVQTMTYVVSDGKSNWLEGIILIGLYIIIAVSFWYYPGSTLPSSLAACHADLSALN
ncbi:Sodium/calcium exchanger protein-domain-containing protein [Desarmillaria tabescens]|uniref:Sodium/calcium exchanger protein-domain-containing protein n=1 Tax=Armillaria tabescens TaxID=1929756 RepID=A0AA39NQB5_ARMTA|nr:Sodium/calcium exchanger protein-domain-containing protein [Desarmillaria tabescens]KAK0469654.1 Sodium/calcium exchanger protein-domain-containing protein [Desarmillaria tabescens]